MLFCFLIRFVFFRTTNSLQEALDSSQTGDFVILGNGNFEIRSAGGLEEGGTIKGIGAKEQTIIEPTEINCGPSLFDFNGDVKKSLFKILKFKVTFKRI